MEKQANTNEARLAEFEALIGRHNVFCLLDQSGIHQLALLAKEVDFAANDIIVKEGDTVQHLYIIISGAVEVTRKIANVFTVEVMRVAILTAGDAIGLAAANFFSLSGVRTATVKAISPVKLMQFALQDFYHFLDSPDIHYPGLKNYTEKFFIAELIVNTHLFPELNKLKIQHIAISVKKIPVESNQVICKWVEVADKYFCLFAGKASVYKRRGADETCIKQLEATCFFNESSFFDDEKSTNILVRADTDCILLCLDRRDHIMYLHKKNSFAGPFVRWLNTLKNAITNHGKNKALK